MKEKIKILQAIRQGKIGGGETHVMNLVEALNPNHFESVILSFTEGPMVDQMREKGYRVYVIETERPFDSGKWNEVEKIIRNENIDIVHAHGTRANSNTHHSARKLQIPLIYTVHGWSFHQDQNFILKTLRILGERYLVHKSTLTICVSKSNLVDGRKSFPMKRATVITSGIDLNKFDPNNTFHDIRHEFSIEEDTIIVGYIVRITKQKDPLTLLEAIALIPDTYNVKFLFVGDGDLKDTVIEVSKKLKVFHRIIFVEFRQDIPDILSAIAIYCLPSLWEGLPIGLLEAMAMGKAIVATEIDGTKEVINHMENGLLIPVKQPRLLADALIILIQKENLRKDLGGKARELIKKEFTIDRMTNEIQTVYKQVTDS